VGRVLFECCGSEAIYNPYYAALGRRLLRGQEGDHRFTLQLCFWDLFKALKEGQVRSRRAANLAALLAALLAGEHALNLASVLKPVDVLVLCGESPVAMLFFKKLLLALLAQEDDSIADVCAKLGASREALVVRDQLTGEEPFGVSMRRPSPFLPLPTLRKCFCPST
jgi:hypothetical protein